MEVIRMSNINVERLLKDAVLTHLTKDELGAYHDNAVDEVARARIEAHLSRCLICERKLAMMQETLATYHQETVTEKDVALVKALLRREPEDRERISREMALAALRVALTAAFTAWIKQHHIRVSLAGAEARGLEARGLTEPQDGQMEDGSLRWRVVEEDSGELVVRFGSHRTELGGVNLVLKAGPIRKRFVLKPVTEDQVGAKVAFTRKERAELSEDAQLTIDILT